MTPAEFRALLEKVTPRPWLRPADEPLRIIASDERGTFVGKVSGAPSNEASLADASAIVATMNGADLLAELWAAVKENHMPPDDPEGRKRCRICTVLAKLEES